MFSRKKIYVFKRILEYRVLKEYEIWQITRVLGIATYLDYSIQWFKAKLLSIRALRQNLDNVSLGLVEFKTLVASSTSMYTIGL